MNREHHGEQQREHREHPPRPTVALEAPHPDAEAVMMVVTVVLLWALCWVFSCAILQVI